jgi:hypothetical protein
MDIQEIIKRNKEEWPVSRISEASRAAGQYHFDPTLMRICGDVKANFVVLCRGERIFLKRHKPARYLPTPLKLGVMYPFDPQTGLLGMPDFLQALPPELVVELDANES